MIHGQIFGDNTGKKVSGELCQKKKVSGELRQKVSDFIGLQTARDKNNFLAGLYKERNDKNNLLINIIFINIYIHSPEHNEF